MLRFNPERYRFQSIENTIRYFYPIGLALDDAEYVRFQGLKEMTDLVAAAVHNEQCYQETWVSFENEVKVQSKKAVIGSTYGQEPSYSANLIIEKSKQDNLTRIKELHFTVSLLGPYYTVIGQDKTIIHTVRNDQFQATNYLVVSPENGFNDSFHLICKLIEERFSGYQFIPAIIYQQTLKNISVQYNSIPHTTVFHALFNSHPDIYIDRKIGDDCFKITDWEVEGYNDSMDRKWQAYSSRN